MERNENNPIHYLKIIDPLHVTAVEVTFWEREGSLQGRIDKLKKYIISIFMTRRFWGWGERV